MPGISPLSPVNRTLTVIATKHAHLSSEDVYPEDHRAEGQFNFRVPAHLPDGEAAACALGIYHSLVPVKRLWNFEFKVVDDQGEEFEHDPGADFYELADACKELWVGLREDYGSDAHSTDK